MITFKRASKASIPQYVENTKSGHPINPYERWINYGDANVNDRQAGFQIEMPEALKSSRDYT